MYSYERRKSLKRKSIQTTRLPRIFWKKWGSTLKKYVIEGLYCNLCHMYVDYSHTVVIDICSVVGRYEEEWGSKTVLLNPWIQRSSEDIYWCFQKELWETSGMGTCQRLCLVNSSAEKTWYPGGCEWKSLASWCKWQPQVTSYCMATGWYHHLPTQVSEDSRKRTLHRTLFNFMEDQW